MKEGDMTVQFRLGASAALSKKLERDLVGLRSLTEHIGYSSTLPSPNDYGFARLPFDEEGIAAYESFAARYNSVDLVIVVGIGGSNLGTMAVQQALLGSLYNELVTARGIPKIFYADTIDPHSMRDITLILQRNLMRYARVLIIAVSKSGTTTETIANFELLIETMRVNHKREEPWQDSIVVITESDSNLAHTAREYGFVIIPHPVDVGGRYSVLSCVGLFPLAVLGVDIRALCAGARAMQSQCFLPNQQNPAALCAASLHAHYRAGRSIHNLFIFAPDYEGLGRWHRQLMAESLGKAMNASGKREVHIGITPTVSVGTTDLHSIGQRALAGPDDTFTTFVRVESSVDARIPFLPAFADVVAGLQGKDFSMVYDAIYHGTLQAYRDAKRPYAEIIMHERSPYAIGEFLQFWMLTVVYLAKLLDVNPFDQPAVESYKIHARKALERF